MIDFLDCYKKDIIELRNKNSLKNKSRLVVYYKVNHEKINK